MNQSNTDSSEAAPASADLFINRELSWLEFNARVLAEADSPDVPLFERLKFLTIFAANLDEFFMVRVAGLQVQGREHIDEVPPDGLTPKQQLDAVGRRAKALVEEHYRIWNQGVRPGLTKAGVALVSPAELSKSNLDWLDKHFDRSIFPVLTPIVIDPSHPFPHVRNKAINVGVIFAPGGAVRDAQFGLVQVPQRLPRLIPIESKTGACFVALEDVIMRHAASIFPSMKIDSLYAFRVTRNFDIEIDDDEGEDLLLTMQTELRRRERGEAVRLDVSADAPPRAVAWLCKELRLIRKRDVYPADGPLYIGDMGELTQGQTAREHYDEPFTPHYVPPLRDAEDPFEILRQGDVMLHHPYESFEAVVDFVWQAAEDPDVLAIKQTLYRSGGESPLVRALQRAAETGKQVTALVELKARFDEASNIQWARALERSGVNVMYGLVGLKLHAKVLLVVRREGDGLRRYVHLATGNYNQQTARLYEDISLFTAREDIGEDATSVFNLLTGYSTPARWNHMVVAPLGLHETVLGLIHRETKLALDGKPSRIVAKLNSLVDADAIRALYAASQAGVEIDLLVRGICCLRPGVPGVSETIRVHTVIDRFLEHARIFYFANGDEPEVFCSSADWMPRNFRRRVEVMFPVLDPELRKRIKNEILDTMRADNVKGWFLRPDGRYVRVERKQNAPAVRSQQRFMDLARERMREDTLAIGGPIGFLPVTKEKRSGKKRKKRKPR